MTTKAKITTSQIPKALPLSKPIIRRAIFAGSFDPFHLGHLGVLRKATKLFDEVWVVVSWNANKDDQADLEERFQMVKKYLRREPKVKVKMNSDLLTIEYARKNKINWLIRGIRDKDDLAHEIILARDNHILDSDIETVILVADAKLKQISSTGLKEIAKFRELPKRK